METDFSVFDSKVIDFEQIALSLHNEQLLHNRTYAAYYNHVSGSLQTPWCFLPVELFKQHQVVNGNFEPEVVFTSSGTTGDQPSRHYVKQVAVYEQSFLTAFRMFYGEPSNYIVMALLPSYLEREGSSLVYMCQRLISESGNPFSGFYLHAFEELYKNLQLAKTTGKTILLIGVTYALLDLAEQFPVDLNNHIVMETGGMKGRRTEWIRSEVHERLKNAFQVSHIHSEYGMTELLSQAYATQDGIFRCPPWMRVYVSDVYDVFQPLPHGKTGRIQIVDLANFNSCPFIQTSDLGKTHPDGSFEILGRIDHSDLRGCNLLYGNG